MALRILSLVSLLLGTAHGAPCPVGKKVVIDNGDSGYSETGDDWTSWASGGQSIGNDYRYLSHTVGGSDRKGTATWAPNLIADGIYKVEAVFRATFNRTHDADYFVYCADGKKTHKVVDQVDGAKEGTTHGPVYSNLGQYHMTPQKGYVVLDGTDDNYSDEADAVVFTLISCTTAPDQGVPLPDAGIPDSHVAPDQLGPATDSAPDSTPDTVEPDVSVSDGLPAVSPERVIFGGCAMGRGPATPPTFLLAAGLFMLSMLFGARVPEQGRSATVRAHPSPPQQEEDRPRDHEKPREAGAGSRGTSAAEHLRRDAV